MKTQKQRKYTEKLEKAGINLLTASKGIAEATDDTAYKFYRFNAEINDGDPMVLICAVGDRAKELSKFFDDYVV